MAELLGDCVLAKGDVGSSGGGHYLEWAYGLCGDVIVEVPSNVSLPE